MCSSDLPEDEREAACARLIKSLRWRGPWFAISAVSGAGCRELSFAAMEFLESDEVRKQGLALEALEADAKARTAVAMVAAVGGVGHEH